MVHVVSEEELAAETPTDLRLDEDRQVRLGGEKDMDQISGLGNVGQSLVILTGDVLRPLLGGPVTGQQLERIQDEIRRALQDDVQIDDVRRAEITEVDRASDTITVKVFVGLNNEFTLPVEL